MIKINTQRTHMESPSWRSKVDNILSRCILLLLLCLSQACDYETRSDAKKESAQKDNPVQEELKAAKPRTIITTDGEIDDVDSYIRMLLYANEFSIEGLVISSSMWHYKGDGKGTLFTSEMEMTKKMYGTIADLRWPGIEWMNPLIDAYEAVYPKLSQHAEGFPTAKYLRSLVKIGNIDFEGEMEKETEGSEFIKDILLDDQMKPIYLQVWGGTNTIARALKSIEDEYKDTKEWTAIYKKVCDKAIIYAILDQDATYRKYIAPNWPDIKVLYNAHQFWCFAYAWKQAVPESQHYLFEGEFMGNEIINNHGPLLKQYYSYGDGQKQEGDDEHIHGDPGKMKGGQWGDFSQYDFISEGDSPAYFHLIDVGLDNIDHPEWGGWGGRLVQSKEQPNRWEDGEAAADYNPFTKKMDPSYPQIRWVEAIQQDFAARADWCIKDYADANHAPVISVNENKISAKPGEKIIVKASANDPDGHEVNLIFWEYKEAGTGEGTTIITPKSKTEAEVTLSSDFKKGDSVHIIVEGKDEGTPSLSKYQRVIITII